MPDRHDVAGPPPPEFVEAADLAARIAGLPAPDRGRLAERARHAPLYAHAYAFHLNFRFGTMAPSDLLDFAREHSLSGVKIHVEDGEERSLLRTTDAHRRSFRDRAAELGLPVHLEISTTDRRQLAGAVDLCRQVGAASLRCYARYPGRVSDVMRQVVEDLKALVAMDPGGVLAYTLEQHEDLTSREMVEIVRAVDHPRLSLLFDFGNMTNAYERPLEALAVQAPHVTQAHLKDCRIVGDRGGWGHVACATGTGHLPIASMLVELLLLGGDAPQVTSIGLEEEEGYFAPAYRFPGEGSDPEIPPRTESFTDPGTGDMAGRLDREAEAAARQVATVRAMLAEIETLAGGRGG